MDNTDEQIGFGTKAIIVGVLLIIGIVLFLIFKPFTIINPGQRGLIMTFGSVQNRVLGEGLHWYTPVVNSVKKVSIRVKRDDVKAEAASKDLQDVHMDIAVNWHLDPRNLVKTYQGVGDEKDVVDKLIGPAVSEVVKSSTAQFTAEDIIKKRNELKNIIDKELITRLDDYGVFVDDVSLVNVDFSQEFNAAIESKQVAEQEAQKAKFIADKAIREAEARVNQAKGEAEAQRLQQQTLSPELLQKMWIDKWNGGVPQYVGGDAGNVFFQVPGR